MSALAYKTIQNATESPRDVEYRLFAAVTRALIAAKTEQGHRMVRALDWNKRVWSTLQHDCASDENRLPPKLRAGLISLSLWVERHSRMVVRNEAAVDPLIDVNRRIMAGLAAQT